MSIFDYLMVLLSVVLSLGLVHLLNGIASLFHSRTRVLWSSVYLLWMVEVLILHFDFWVYTWSMNARTEYTVGEIGLVFLLVSAIYLTATALVPKFPARGTINLYVTWQRIRIEFLAVYLAYLGLILVLNLISFRTWEAMMMNNLFYVFPYIILAGLALAFPNKHVQRLAVGIIVALDLFRYIFVQPSIS